MPKLKIGVLGSTRGTSLQATIDAIKAGKLDAEIALVISNKEDAYILTRAKVHDLPAVFVESRGKEREDFDQEILKRLAEKGVELVLLVGYMRFLSQAFVEKYRNKILNIHPSLLPAFAGGMDRNVHKDVLDYGVKVTGCTLHFVDEGADSGPIVLQKAIDIGENDTVETLKEKVQHAEGENILKGLRLFMDGRLQVEGRKVKILPEKG